MILVGFDAASVQSEVVRYVGAHPIRRVVVIATERFAPSWEMPVAHEVVPWSEVQKYRTFYRLLQEIDGDTLVVVFEGLRSQDRQSLDANCVRHYLRKTPHRIIAQRLPIIDALDDVMVLVDWSNDSRWKRERARPELLRDVECQVRPIDLRFEVIAVETTPKERDAYAREKRALIDGIGLRDPHTIPRNLALLGGKAKARWARAWGDAADDAPPRRYLGRNTRLGLSPFDTYEAARAGEGPYTVVEFCHRTLDFCDAVTATGQSRFDVLVTDLKVDAWYFDRFTAWAGRVRDAYAALRG